MNNRSVRGWYLAGMVVALTLVGCNEAVEESPAQPPVVSVMELAAERVNLADELPGRVVALRTAQIRPQVSGVVLQRLFEQGAEVKAGQPLFQINPAPFQADADVAAANLQRAQAALTRARLQTERLQPLAEVDAVSRQVFDDAASQRDQAAADVAQAKAALVRRQLDLKFATVDAPISGRIDQALVTEGALVAQTDANPMATIQQIDQVYVDVRQPATMLETIRAAVASGQLDDARGLPAILVGNSGAAYPNVGHILFSGISVDAGTGDVAIRIVVDNPGRHLLPGMFVRARVPRGVHPDALLVPQQAVQRDSAGRASIWVVDGHKHARRLPIELGEIIEQRYLVRTGLQAGNAVVVEGQERLQEGAQVTARAWTAGAARTESP